MFISGKTDLAVFLEAFHLDLASFLGTLRKAKAVVTGVQVILFMAGRWRRERELNASPLGEWKGIPRQKQTCMVKGRFMQRAVHLIELPRPAVQTALSRVYGSMAGTYITGAGKAVSLFPQLTFAERRCWVPKRYSDKARSSVAAKYRGWNLLQPGERAGKETSECPRKVADSLCWILSFDTDRGILLPESAPGMCVQLRLAASGCPCPGRVCH
ncbi:hypothetical protein HIM_10567 [Hirsutella minnesotensis 3608]|uniref:Uncharacterized protein n=1 Tax=Hirsutella minnesotensis 3608 TaxID=1043627 RepID=A0A0F8A249_9HYPO|nr:hypothetical protein HIM_10567 [Hirsutella minnesotensis 3608]